MNHRTLQTLLIVLIVLVIGGAGATVWWIMRSPDSSNNNATTTKPGFTRFSSAADFSDYLQTAQQLAGSSSYSGPLAKVSSGSQIEDIGTSVGLGSADTGTATPSIDRTSTTNVQVAGIDEPDIVKTNGTSLFVSTDTSYFYPTTALDLKETATPSTNTGSTGSGASSISRIMPTPEQVRATTKVVNPIPAATMKTIGSITDAGEMLLADSTLVVFSEPRYPELPAARIIGYGVSDPAAPAVRWTNTLEKDSTVVTARLRQGKVYVVLQNSINRATPCPIKIMAGTTTDLTVPCGEIFHPVRPVTTDTTYTALVINPTDGAVEKRLSFVGSGNGTTVSMFNERLYITYTESVDPVNLEYDFFTEAASDLVPITYRDRLKKLQDYDISTVAKMTELESILEDFTSTLTSTDQEELSKTMQTRMDEYEKRHIRDYLTTSVVSITLDDLRVASTGRVPGIVLNQYALDDYQNYLRIATTSSGGNMWFGGSNNSVNDVYVLDQGLKTVGSVLDLGKGERIYSVRFVGALGYVVTFRQTDPFYVLNLASPTAPTLAGELKIPGFSSYLHPLSDTLILGVGQDNSRVKVSLFDVAKPDQPAEIAKYELPSYSWSEVQQNPRAFLQDAKHQVVFLPTGTTGQVISYANNALSKVATVTSSNVRRAVFINDTMYVVSENGITALDENNWQSIGQLTW